MGDGAVYHCTAVSTRIPAVSEQQEFRCAACLPFSPSTSTSDFPPPIDRSLDRRCYSAPLPSCFQPHRRSCSLPRPSSCTGWSAGAAVPPRAVTSQECRCTRRGFGVCPRAFAAYFTGAADRRLPPRPFSSVGCMHQLVSSFLPTVGCEKRGHPLTTVRPCVCRERNTLRHCREILVIVCLSHLP